MDLPRDRRQRVVWRSFATAIPAGSALLVVGLVLLANARTSVGCRRCFSCRKEGSGAHQAAVDVERLSGDEAGVR